MSKLQQQQYNLKDLTPYDEAYLEQVANGIDQGANLQAVVNKLTATCWRTCFGKTPSFPLSNKDRDCLANCATKYTETSSFLIDVLTEEAAAEIKKNNK